MRSWDLNWLGLKKPETPQNTGLERPTTPGRGGLEEKVQTEKGTLTPQLSHETKKVRAFTDRSGEKAKGKV